MDNQDEKSKFYIFTNIGSGVTFKYSIISVKNCICETKRRVIKYVWGMGVFRRRVTKFSAPKAPERRA